jgi:hypothetical protein
MLVIAENAGIFSLIFYLPGISLKEKPTWYIIVKNEF